MMSSGYTYRCTVGTKGCSDPPDEAFQVVDLDGVNLNRNLPLYSRENLSVARKLGLEQVLRQPGVQLNLLAPSPFP